MPKEPSPINDRVEQLSQRFKRHNVGRRPQNTRTRERQSLYLDTELMQRADQSYRDLGHQLYPQTLSKSLFWETLIGYGLDHLDEIKHLVSETTESSDGSVE
jgi:hypothetical protein